MFAEEMEELQDSIELPQNAGWKSSVELKETSRKSSQRLSSLQALYAVFNQPYFLPLTVRR